MSPVFKKMNLKPNHNPILVVDAPDSFDSEITLLEDVVVNTDPAEITKTTFALAFAITVEQLEAAAAMLAEKTEGDAVVWLAYPKTSSKKYKGEFNRDTSWGALGKHGFEPVRQVAIDADWSALRFRRVEFIKSLKRSNKRAATAEGKKRTQDNQ